MWDQLFVFVQVFETFFLFQFEILQFPSPSMCFPDTIFSLFHLHHPLGGKLLQRISQLEAQVEKLAPRLHTPCWQFMYSQDFCAEKFSGVGLAVSFDPKDGGIL